MEMQTFENLHVHKKLKHPYKAKRQQLTQFIMNLSGKEFESYISIKKWIEKFDLSHR